MRARRSFVVEFKSSRRQPKSQSASIWGDTDLKAIAREIEHKPLNSFPTEEISDTTPPLSADMPVQGDDKVSEAALTTAPPNERGANVPTPPSTEQQHPGYALAEEGQTSETCSPVAVQGVSAKRNLATQPQSKPGRSKASSGNRLVSPSTDELAKLESENRRLKALLRSRLEAENAQLSMMLLRFYS
ncbi:hypothetical protein [Mycoplana dimorpha]|uniref:hypothetical protein n=1 Tax=Mycoplana dimorpha TaxID=28320 RepID=UPI0035BC918A